MTDHTIITIGRQFGSGGHEIGNRLAERLDIPLYDHNLIRMAAKELKVSDEEASRVDVYKRQKIDGANWVQRLVNIVIPLIRPAMNSVIILSLVGGLRCFDLIWAMTGGGPGFATDVLASVIYKQYAAGYYGLSTAGNVIMFILIAVIAYPLQRFLLKREEG